MCWWLVYVQRLHLPLTYLGLLSLIVSWQFRTLHWLARITCTWITNFTVYHQVFITSRGLIRGVFGRCNSIQFQVTISSSTGLLIIAWYPFLKHWVRYFFILWWILGLVPLVLLVFVCDAGLPGNAGLPDRGGCDSAYPTAPVCFRRAEYALSGSMRLIISCVT